MTGVQTCALPIFEASDRYLRLAEEELTRSHNLEFVAAFLTIALLAGGLTGTFESTRMRLGLLGISIVVLAGCITGAVVFW